MLVLALASTLPAGAEINTPKIRHRAALVISIAKKWLELISRFTTLPLDLPQPKLIGINAEPELQTAELAAKPPQKPVQQQQQQRTPQPPPKPSTPPPRSQSFSPSTMDYPADADADPWNTPDVHKHHQHHSDDVVPTLSTTQSTNAAATNGDRPQESETNGGGSDQGSYPSMSMSMPAPSTDPISSYTSPTPASPPRHPSLSASATGVPSSTPSTGGWGGLYDNTSLSTPIGFGDALRSPPANPFGGPSPRQQNASQEPAFPRAISSGRTGNSLEEVVTVNLMPEKEGIFLFQHHNYEVSSSRRGSKVVRRYSDFTWLLECLHKRYPFRALPPLPPKRVAGRNPALHTVTTVRLT